MSVKAKIHVGTDPVVEVHTLEDLMKVIMVPDPSIPVSVEMVMEDGDREYTVTAQVDP